MQFSHSELAPREARDALGAFLRETGCPDHVAGDVLIVLDELVTNVVMHAASESVVVALLDDHRLRIEVHDRDPRPPIAVEPRPSGGFGLAIVSALTDGWGWEPTDYGKRVWTETLC